ncbi:MAG: hypothetical protein WCF91_03260 [bacterium]
MESQESTKKSIFRLRLGVVFILLWWIPFWIVTPAIADLFNIPENNHHGLIIKVIAVQTVLGLIGAFIAGKEVMTFIKHTSFKKVPKTIYLALRYGKIPSTKKLAN